MSTSADIEKYEADLAKRVSHPLYITPTSISYHPMNQTQVKVAPLRDYPAERITHRATGRQSSSVPDQRRASLASFADTDDRNSREPTPRLGNGTASGSAPVVRRLRKSPSASMNVRRLMFPSLPQPRRSTLPTALPYISSPQQNKHYVHNYAFYPSPILSSRRPSCASTPGEAGSCGGGKRAILSKSTSTRRVVCGTSLSNRDI